MDSINGYELSRNFWDWSFSNPEKVKPIHSAIYFFAVEHCNRLGWKDKFGFPSQMVMEAIGVKNWRTYSAGLSDLVDFGFIKMVETSRNQYSSNIIAIVNFTKANTKALDKALSKHSTKHSQGTVSIDKQYNKEQINNITSDFNIFWDAYNKKVDSKKCKDKFLKLSNTEVEKILNVVEKYVKSTPDPKFRKNPLTWLNGKCWEDEIEVKPVRKYNAHDNMVF